MKIFLKRLFLFFLPILLFVVIAEYAIRQLPNSYKYKHHWMQENAFQVDCLILGSSHTYYGVKPDLLSEHGFSLANVSQTIPVDRDLLFQYSMCYDSLRSVIVPVSYFSLFQPPMESPEFGEPFRFNYYTIYMDFPSKWYELQRHFEIFSYDAFVKKLKKEIKGIILGTEIKKEFDEYGWFRAIHEDANWSEDVARAAVERHRMKDGKYLNYNLSALCDIILFCKKNGIYISLITTPTHPLYSRNVDALQMSIMQSVIDSVSSKYNIPYHNYFNDNRFEDADFYDPDHLSDVGAEKFSLILKKDIMGCVE